MHRTIPTRLREFSAWMRGPGRDEPMRSHPMLAALMDEAAEEGERLRPIVESVANADSGETVGEIVVGRLYLGDAAKAALDGSLSQTTSDQGE